MLLFALVLVAAAGAQTAVEPSLVSMEVLAMKIPVWDTFPAPAPIALTTVKNCFVPSSNRSAYNGRVFNEGVVPNAKLPFDIFVSVFFRIKEWSDNTTTMDNMYTLAGGAFAVGNFDFLGLGVEELYERVPVTRDYEQTSSSVGRSLGIGVKENITVETFWDAPVAKSKLSAGGGTRYAVFVRDGVDNIMYPQAEITYVPEGEWRPFRVSEVVELIKWDDGQWEFNYHNLQLVLSTDPYFHENRGAIFRYVEGASASYEWYHAGDGVTGGVGNPPMIQIDPTIQQVYV